MSNSPDGTQDAAAAMLALANQLFQEYRARCFWHSPPDLVVTAEQIPFVLKGLRNHGGRAGFLAAGKLAVLHRQSLQQS